ncbi:uncharacterized protein LAESUDRAFT_764523 [Laetiporus sulphureus 93-53]|uniref:Uncharacterized protein n=1 Tax=Laetiporus sulphureus 93-53 TaxID=1314785 RepID=A0A165B945_9APHY|nr:uncharacterized protein LAESUDRAFT_764523 [Laetiporus sulphureus 93-53]KZT00530.1 hypothetical protein LAESUDRAFT_764523 [Laetiporus sulphureus 93-53]
MSSSTGGTRPVPDGSSSNIPARPFPIYWSQFPSIKIVRQPKGRYSPQVDERCVTYCSQTVRGRAEQREPSCRTICIRHVFAHEVSRVIAAHDGQRSTATIKYPLPPEGQHAPGVIDLITGETPEHDGHGAHREEKHWDEGYYLWFSKSRWAAQERIDLMMNDLERQTEWERYKQRMTEEWEHQQQRQRSFKGVQPPSPTPAIAEEALHPELTKPSIQEPIQPPSVPARRPFPDLAGQSLLLPLPPQIPPIHEQIRTLLAPTHRALELTHESLHTGAQWTFAQRMWDKAFTEEPFVLARTVCSRMWEKWKKGPPSDDESM